MATRRSRSKRELAGQATELALAVPQVVAHRVWRMATAGPQPSTRDRREFTRMGSEKAAAFFESWWAMGWHVARLQQQAWLSLFGIGVSPWVGHGAQRAATAVLGTGLAPVRRRAVANAKRLSRLKL
jgi:hypothetical protein